MLRMTVFNEFALSLHFEYPVMFTLNRTKDATTLYAIYTYIYTYIHATFLNGLI